MSRGAKSDRPACRTGHDLRLRLRLRAWACTPRGGSSPWPTVARDLYSDVSSGPSSCSTVAMVLYYLQIIVHATTSANSYMLLTKSCVQRYCTSVAYYKDMYNMNQISYSGHRREASQDTGTWFFTYTYECMN